MRCAWHALASPSLRQRHPTPQCVLSGVVVNLLQHRSRNIHQAAMRKNKAVIHPAHPGLLNRTFKKKRKMARASNELSIHQTQYCCGRSPPDGRHATERRRECGSVSAARLQCCGFEERERVVGWEKKEYVA